jgi:outer membrane protein OmpA-like peptidoglycan-associated protein
MISFLGQEKNPSLSVEDNLIACLTAPISETSSLVSANVEIKTSALTVLKGIILDAVTKTPLAATITLTDNATGKELANFKSNSKTGKYLVTLPAGKNYGIAVKNDGYLFHSENFEIPASSSYQEIVIDIPLKNVSVGSRIVLKNVFYDFNKATLRNESQTELNLLIKLLNDVPTMRIELSSHTDNKGTEKYNLDLSERRSTAVVEYLVTHGIDAKRLESKGYGFSDPLAPNDTEAGRQMNRRTEFKILSR